MTDAEVTRRYPCDDHLDAPAEAAWRGVTVEAPVAAVWPWVCQIQLAPYSYDWVDNLGRRSPQELRGLPDPEPGQPFTRALGGWAVGEVLAVEHERHYTGRILNAFLSYVLVPQGETTRLLMKLAVPGPAVYGRAIVLGDLPMARRQLLNLKRLAEAGR